MPFFDSKKHRFGYTIIELLIVIATFSIILSIGFAGFRNAQKKQELSAAVQAVKTDLRYVQELALSNRSKPATCEVLKGYKLKYVSLTSYKISAYCNSGATTVDIDLPSSARTLTDKYPNTTFSSNFGEVAFLTLGKGVESNVTITISTSGVGSQPINVTQGGQIN